MSVYHKPDIKHVAVVGTGKMGTSLFDCFLNCGARLTWVTRSAKRAEELRRKIEKRLRRNVKHGVLSEEVYTKLKANTCIAEEYAVLSECDLIIETVTERAGIKKATLGRIFSNSWSSAVVASNSSSILPSELIVEGVQPERLCGLHFFYPVDMTRMVEFVVPDRFHQAACGPVIKFLKQFGFTTVLQNEYNGFLINMLTMPIAGGAFEAAERVGFQRANELASSAVFPAGPLRLFDHVGVDIIMESNKRYWERDVFNNRETFARLFTFMKAMAEAKKRDPLFRMEFLSGNLNYPHDLPGWSKHQDAGKELAHEATEKIRKKNMMLLLGACTTAVERKLIDADDLETAAKISGGREKDLLKWRIRLRR